MGLTFFTIKFISESLMVETRKLIELARALSIDPDILLLDEITQSLSHNNRAALYKLINKFREMGKSIILISHDIEEMIDITDSITVLRDGEIIGTQDSRNTKPEIIKTMMVGRKISGDYYRSDTGPSYNENVVLEATGISIENELNDISFQLHEGEILGFCGLSDSGIHTIGKVLYGLAKPEKGSVVLKKIRDTAVFSPEMALRSGMAYVPKDRDKEAIMLNANIVDNLCLPSYDDLKGKFGYLNASKLKEMASKTSKMFDVKSTGINQKLSSLSGGNKQKVSLGRWLIKELNVLVLDCPTRGVDVGVKAFIYSLMKEAKAKKLGIVLISDELTEALGMADRLIIMKDGKIGGEILRGKDFTEERVIGYMI
jgi:ribose transport system ATP-binding protein